MKSPFTFLLAFLCTFSLAAQCDFKVIPSTDFVITEVGSQDAVHVASRALDGDPLTYWRTNGNDPFPHQLMIDLGQTYSVSQVKVLPPADNKNGKLFDYEIYLSMDGTNWGPVQAKGAIPYISVDDQAEKIINFGAIDARYLRLAAFSNFDAGNNINRLLIAELTVLEDPCGPTGEANQHINFSPIKKSLTTDPTFQLWSTVSSGQPVQYEVVSGSATITGDMLSPGNQEGPVVVRAFQEGNDDYYPTEAFRVFDLINPANYSPNIRTRLTEAFPIETKSLNGYPLYASATIEHPDLMNITGIDFVIDNTPHAGVYENGAYVFWWLPPNYGDFNIKIIATASNGETTEVERTITVAQPGSDRAVQTFSKDLIDFNNAGRDFIGTYQLPQFIGTYDLIIGDLDIECPNTPAGCDDWDRLAYIQIKAPNGNWVEFVRYITPFGVGCSHKVDLTDYASLLQGEAEIRVFIGTWGTGGWNVSFKINYESGTPEYLYSKVDVLWEGNYPFGNYANLQPLDTLSYTFAEDAEEVKMVLVTTGHGWGPTNSLNAAEFFRAKHQIKVDNASTFEQDLWMDCNPNPDGCTGQMGTWENNRAGWCPGAIGKTYEYDFTNFIAQKDIGLSYIFQESYMDLCHPSHPDCVTGVTCENCDDGFNPQYQVRGHMISRTNASLASPTQNLNRLSNFKLYPNPSTGLFQINSSPYKGALNLEIQTVDGKLIKAYQFDQMQYLERQVFDLSDQAKGTYMIRIVVEEGVQILKWVKH